MTIMNSLPRSWEPFTKVICSRRNLTKFSRLWEDCTQEEARMGAREEKLSNEENQALIVHARKGKNKTKNHPPRKFQKSQKTRRDHSNIKCFSCQKMGHIARNCPLIKDQIIKRKNKRHHAHATEDDELDQKKERKND